MWWFRTVFGDWLFSRFQARNICSLYVQGIDLYFSKLKINKVIMAFCNGDRRCAIFPYALLQDNTVVDCLCGWLYRWSWLRRCNKITTISQGQKATTITSVAIRRKVAIIHKTLATPTFPSSRYPSPRAITPSHNLAHSAIPTIPQGVIILPTPIDLLLRVL